ncbi:MAG: alpha/beta hydrolase, partial [Woeseiaceae bacterium]|nr:alpha/beta hydrolase [Woeseiaceae bacterium]
MKTVCVILLALGLSACASAQEVIELSHEDSPAVTWENDERQYFSDIWNTPVVTNVAVPTMRVFRPPAEIANGTAVIIAPGGGFYALSIESEGNAVARWLAEKGFTAFVLKYRLVPTGADGVRELSEAGDRFVATVVPVLPLATADGLNAVRYVRQNAARFGIDPARIGFMGFSAGGTVTMGVMLKATPESRPDFVVPVYPWTKVLGDFDVPDDAPPMLVVCASDDGLGLAPESVSLYSAWQAAGVSAALHMYARGDHGFGMRRQNLPSDNW